MLSSDPLVWISAFFYIACLTLLIKNNVIYRFALYTMVGGLVAHNFVLAITSINKMGIHKVVMGESVYILVLIFGALTLLRLVPRYGWVSMYPTSLILGIGTGITLGPIVEARIVSQIRDSIRPLTGDIGTSFGNLVMLIGVITVISYFFFTLIKENKAFQMIRNIGRYFMLMTFASALASTFITRAALTLNFLKPLLWEWLGLRPL